MDINPDKLIEIIDAKSLLVSRERNVLILFTVNFTFFSLYKKLEKKFKYISIIIPFLILIYYIDSIYHYYILLINVDPNINYLYFILIHIITFLLIIIFSFILYFNH